MSEAGGRRAAPGALSPRARAVIAAGLAGLVLGFLWGAADVPRYTAAATVLVEGRDGSPAEGAELGAAAELAGSARVAERAAGLIGGDVSGADLLSDVDATAEEDAGAVRIDAEADSPDFAAAAANGYALALVEVGGKRFAEGSEATLAASPSEDRPALLWAVLGLVAGLLVGALAVAVRARSASRRRPAGPRPDPGRPVAEPVLPVLASFADPGEIVTLAGGAVAIDRDTALPLADQLGVGNGEDAVRLIAAFDAADGDGAAEVLAGLAAVAVERGRRAIVVEADLDRPRLATRLGIVPSPGLHQYLLGTAGPRDVLRRAPLTGGAEGAAVVCVPAGERTAAPADGVGGDRFAALMQRLPRVYDLVLVVAPPAGRAGGEEIAGLVDGAIVVARAGEDAEQRIAIAAGRLAAARLLGAVLTGDRAPQSRRQGAIERRRG